MNKEISQALPVRLRTDLRAIGQLIVMVETGFNR